MYPDFINEPFTDFHSHSNREAMQAAIAKVRTQLGGEYPLVIGDRTFRADTFFPSINPAHKSEVIGKFSKASKEMAESAVEAAAKAYQSWRKVTAFERAELLVKTAALLREHKHELSAWMVYEVGKTWAEADGDTAEAIDFCEFYAREILRYSAPQLLVKIPGEDNRLEYIPLGVCVVIPPWNFPLAIMAGMTVAAVVTGNTVVLKPSSDSPAIAYKFFELLQKAGLPPGVVNFITGSGAEVGDTIIDHPKTRLIAFTGSKEIGLRVSERAAKINNGQVWIKRVIAEMGGKDAIVVDADANLESAATGIVQSAFGFQGQKCSACSRVIIHKTVHDHLVEQIVGKTNQLKLGDPTEHSTGVSAVINDKAFKSINTYIERAVADGGRIITGGGSESEEGFFIEPTIIIDVKPGDTIEQEEIFGPVLAVIKAEDFNHALEIANDTEFGLTGALYTDDPAKIEYARKEFHVGNLYFNRKCTGALVGVHPFGGFNMSGTDSKAGGRDYLGLFMQAKLTSEKII